MKIKVLPLDSWMVLKRYRDSCTADGFYIATAPVFNRPGIYKFGPSCWFEVDGEAWTYDKVMFNYQLDLMNAERIMPKQVEALKAIVREGLATKEQRRLLYFCTDSLRIRLQGSRHRARVMKMLREGRGK